MVPARLKVCLRRVSFGFNSVLPARFQACSRRFFLGINSVIPARLQACPNAAPSLFGRPLYPPGPTPGVPQRSAESLWASTLCPTPGVPQCSAPSLNGLPTFAVPDNWRPAWAPEDRSVSLPPKKGEREKRLHVILIKDNVHAQTVTVRYRLRPGPTQNVYAPSIVRLARCSPGVTQDVHAPSNC